MDDILHPKEKSCFFSLHSIPITFKKLHMKESSPVSHISGPILLLCLPVYKINLQNRKSLKCVSRVCVLLWVCWNTNPETCVIWKRLGLLHTDMQCAYFIRGRIYVSRVTGLCRQVTLITTVDVSLGIFVLILHFFSRKALYSPYVEDCFSKSGKSGGR